MNKNQLSIQVARLYYQLEYSQQQIAKELNISRPTISRLLKYAKDNGFVKITITDPVNDTEKLAQTIKDKYKLRHVIVAQTPSENYQLIVEQISHAASRFLSEQIQSDDILGIGWGMTIYEIAKRMKDSDRNGIQVVQLKGSVTHSQATTFAYEALTLFSEAYHTIGISLPLPVIFDNYETKRIVEQDRHIQHILALQQAATVALYTVGTVRDEALLFQLGYLSEAEKNGLQKAAVGDICSRFYTASGKIADMSVNERTVGIELNALAKKRLSILAAGGAHKLAAIHGALLGGYTNTLITDYWTAQHLATCN
ncbi:sugar-binding transcriptional regulator [Vagococcus vulneris]|uniref:RNA polymerase subunit sigma-70 n=1 Tax=Vagococcus vulneris TaxID=1977869 RepID=A0A430A0C5_9ENTE|nr:sugar-binding transcriptional regulator [Vagococcus vulneris]RST99789.1 RNA polymerase subunit sigma-70 [Vagococcus vulneris]